MKYFSVDTVVNAYSGFQDCMTNKSWGYLALLKGCKSFIQPSVPYEVDMDIVSKFLENIFNLSQTKKDYKSGRSLYVVFSKIWDNYFNDQGNFSPNIYDIIVWAYRRKSFDDNVTNEDIIKLFSEEFNIPSNVLSNSFNTKQKSIAFSSHLYSESELKSRLSLIGVDITKNNIDAKKGGVVASPGEISRGPFVQTLYAGLEITDYVIIMQSDYISLYGSSINPHKTNFKDTLKKSSTLQQIFYGAPGTGKSNTIKREVDDKGLPNVRTTFHPDSDYSTFVGAYKPTSTEVPMMTMIGTKAVPVENPDGTPRKEKKIVYEFVPQAFLKAYTGAWKNQDEPFFLIIEEINRGNCAQIFGDLFQLLDRNDEGESDYPISPDEDIQKFLLTDKKYGFAELTEEQKEAIPEEIKLGQLLKLPKNLHIWATMNTSDQSLFPIDSAFKRRWDWQYMPISDGKKDWKIEVNGKRYDWWLFLVKINEKISDTTNSEDKKLGYYFCKAKNGKIDVETFVGKVIFYLWNDVFKDFAEEAGDLFQDEDGLLTFNKFYMVDTDGKTRVVEDKVELFLKNLGVEEDEVIEYMQDDEAEAMPTDRATDASNRLHVVFSDGETIRIQTGKEYVDVLKKIGLDKAYEIAKSKNPGILKCAFVTKEKEDAIENSSYLRYETIGEYHVVRGMSGDTMRPFLEKISNRYNLGLKFYRQ